MTEVGKSQSSSSLIGGGRNLFCIQTLTNESAQFLGVPHFRHCVDKAEKHYFFINCFIFLFVGIQNFQRDNYLSKKRHTIGINVNVISTEFGSFTKFSSG